jgi:protoporphyrinogen oxidase
VTPVRVGILGAGPAGLGAALGLAERGFDVWVVERETAVGGNAGSFEIAGVRVDYGSHRLHPAADPSVLARLRDLLGDDLLERPRHGRIRLLGRWIHFPLRPWDLALRLPRRFALGASLDGLGRLRPAAAPSIDASFASVLERGLGRTLCREFYFPYARKMWGLEPEEISATQAQRRVSAASMGRLLRRLLPGGAGSGGASSRGRFFYPRGGYGQICERLAEVARGAGARVHLGAPVSRVARRAGGGFEVDASGDARAAALAADHVWSTLPAGLLARLLDPAAPEDVLGAAQRLELRAMLLVYLVVERDRLTEYDAHYFPGPEVPFTRVSEPKNYAALDEPRGRTVLCVELPCAQSDAVWTLEHAALGDLVGDGLAAVGLPVRGQVSEVVVRRLPAAYPIYRRGYEAHFERLDRWLDGIENLLSFGRQGLFAHDNTHHALSMANAAVDCLKDDGSFDREAWGRYRAIFETHVVED